MIVAIAPIGLAGFTARRGECQAVRAAETAGVPFVLSTVSACNLGEVGRALPPIADAVGDRLTVLADGGVRSGLDVLRMLALGAKGVLLGRAWAYALAANGEAGITKMLQLIEAEMRVAMTLTGARTINDINETMLARI